MLTRGTSSANGMQEPDRNNTVERVEITDARQHDIINIEVRAHKIIMSPQPYALVITGAFATTSPIGESNENPKC